MALRFFSGRYSQVLGKSVNSLSAIPSGSRAASSWPAFDELTKSVPATRVSSLDNGLRVASENSGSDVTSVGVWIDGGSRHESASTSGVANFWKRMISTGTAKRSAEDLLWDLSSTGCGQVQSYVGREVSAVYVKCLTENAPKVVEVLADVFQNSKFDEADVEKTRGALLAEREDADMPSMVMHHLHANAFQGTNLALPVDGYSENVQALRRSDLIDYCNTTLVAPRLVLVSAGGLEHAVLEDLANKHFGGMKTSGGTCIPDLPGSARYTGSRMSMRDDDMKKAYVGLALEGCSATSPDLIPLQVAATMLGSWGRHSTGGRSTSNPIGQLCSVDGLADSYQSFNINYRDTGLFGVSFVCDKMNIEEMEDEIVGMLLSMSHTVTDFSIERAKNQLKTSLAITYQEEPAAVSDDIGRQVLAVGRRQHLADVMAQIDAVDGNTFRATCEEYFYCRDPVLVGVGPVEQLAGYANIMGNFYRFRT